MTSAWLTYAHDVGGSYDRFELSKALLELPMPDGRSVGETLIAAHGFSGAVERVRAFLDDYVC